MTLEWEEVCEYDLNMKCGRGGRYPTKCRRVPVQGLHGNDRSKCEMCIKSVEQCRAKERRDVLR